MKFKQILQIALITFAYLRKKDFYDHSSIIAYTAIFSVFPLLLFLASVLGSLARAYNLYAELLKAAAVFMPAEAYQIIIQNAETVLPYHSPWLLVGGSLFALYSASNIVMITIKLIHRLNNLKDNQSSLVQMVTGIGFLLVFALSTLAAVLVVVTLEVYLKAYFPVFWGRTLLLSFAEVALYFLPFALVIAYFYKKSMNNRLGFRESLPGAVFFVSTFVLFSQTLRLIILFVDINKTYGTIGGIILFLLWFRYIAFFLLAGSALNIIIKNRHRYAVI